MRLGVKAEGGRLGTMDFDTFGALVAKEKEYSEAWLDARVLLLRAASDLLLSGHSKNSVAAAMGLHTGSLTSALRNNDLPSHSEWRPRPKVKPKVDPKKAAAGRKGGQRVQDLRTFRENERLATERLLEKARLLRSEFNPEDPANDF